MEIRLFESDSFNPHHNLAIEEALLQDGAVGPALFLWQNTHTVVIGHAQNAWKECRTALLEEEGGTLARRTTGGGAVYHDLGNLNFSFVMPKALYDVPRQLNVIRRAVKEFGVETENSGRNDIVILPGGEKFSGNAFRISREAGLHHGTILMDVDMARLGRYLAPSRQKLEAKGVASVRARVGNLKEHAPGITIPALKEALWAAFAREYGPAMKKPWQEAFDNDLIQRFEERNKSWEWNYGRTPRFDISLEARFPWGGVELLLSLRNARVQEVHCYSDANDPDLAKRVEAALLGAAFTPHTLADRLLESDKAEDRDLGEWVKAQEI